MANPTIIPFLDLCMLFNLFVLPLICGLSLGLDILASFNIPAPQKLTNFKTPGLAPEITTNSFVVNAAKETRNENNAKFTPPTRLD